MDALSDPQRAAPLVKQVRAEIEAERDKVGQRPWPA